MTKTTIKLGEWFESFLKKLENGEREPLFAHEILYNAILSKGTERRPEGYTKYKAFSNEIFGIDYVLDKIMQYFSAAAQGQDIAKRILLLIGPPGSAKSTIVNMFKVILEEWTQKHPVPAIKDCPVHDNPLYAIPYNKRQELKRYGINIGDELLPCPICQKRLQEIEWEDLEIEFISFSRTRGVGIATYAPMDPNTADDSVLIGNISLAKLAQYKEETDPRVWSYTGVLQIGNRGLVEFVEMLKAKTEHLNILLTASQDKMIVLKNLPAMYLDIIIVGHTNQPEYEKFASRPDTEAFRDRLYIVKVPYNLDYKAEIKILRKLNYVPNGFHVDPLFFETAAVYSVIARIVKSAENSELLSPSDINYRKLKTVLHMLDQENPKYLDDHEAKQLRKEVASKSIGMLSSISPRKMSEVISSVISRFGREGASYIDLLNELEQYSKEKYQKEAFEFTKKYTDEIASAYLVDAFLGTNIEEEIESFFKDYFIHLGAYIGVQKVIDPVTGEEGEVDLEKLEVVNKALNIQSSTDRMKELYYRITGVVAKRSMAGGKFELKQDLPDVYEAIKKVMVKTKLKVIGGSVKPDTPLPETRGIIQNIVNNLINKGFTERSAKMLINRLYYILTEE
ncbi:MAG: hypothetical protein QXS19_04380 [Candidatus Methanomethylicia archaeon]